MTKKLLMICIVLLINGLFPSARLSVHCSSLPAIMSIREKHSVDAEHEHSISRVKSDKKKQIRKIVKWMATTVLFAGTAYLIYTEWLVPTHRKIGILESYFIQNGILVTEEKNYPLITTMREYSYTLSSGLKEDFLHEKIMQFAIMRSAQKFARQLTAIHGTLACISGLICCSKIKKIAVQWYQHL